MLIYNLNQQIDSQKLLNDIQNLINKSVNSQHEYIIKIQILPIAYDDTTMIPKIEYKNEPL